MTDTSKHGFRTRLSHTGRAGKRVHGFVNPPLLRGSTVLYRTVAERRALQAKRGERVLTYGLGGSETHWALEDVIAEVEGGTRCAIVCSGLAAVTTPLLAFLKTGDHCLMPDSVYGPARNFADGVLKRFGRRDDVLRSGDRRGRHRRADAAEHHGRLYRKSRAATRSRCRTSRRSRAWRTRARCEGADGQYLGHPPLPAVQARRRCLDPGGDEISSRALGHSDRQRHGEPRRGLADAACDSARAGPVCQPGRLLADAARDAHDGRAAGAADGSGHRGGALAEQSGPR